jgi:hypothetical protein
LDDEFSNGLYTDFVLPFGPAEVVQRKRCQAESGRLFFTLTASAPLRANLRLFKRLKPFVVLSFMNGCAIHPAGRLRRSIGLCPIVVKQKKDTRRKAKALPDGPAAKPKTWRSKNKSAFGPVQFVLLIALYRTPRA